MAAPRFTGVQVLRAIEAAGGLLTGRDIEAITKDGRATKKGKFPSPLLTIGNSNVWAASDVAAWFEANERYAAAAAIEAHVRMVRARREEWYDSESPTLSSTGSSQ